MAGKIVSMSKIKQVLQLYDSRYYNREIARLIVLNKDTVNKYVNTFIESNKSLEELLKLEDPELEKIFNDIQSFLSTKTKYSILFSEPDPTKKKPKIDLGLGSVALSLIKSGYSNVEESNLVHFFEIMYSELIQNVTTLHAQGIPIDKISEQTGLSLKKINQIL
ncbi:MAG: hypothetical protein JJE45_07700 [Prolixibacteraceae bacterium]|nr:hypothetical protein [Prolixibacteraceae bacterium]